MDDKSEASDESETPEESERRPDHAGDESPDHATDTSDEADDGAAGTDASETTETQEFDLDAADDLSADETEAEPDSVGEEDADENGETESDEDGETDTNEDDSDGEEIEDYFPDFSDPDSPLYMGSDDDDDAEGDEDEDDRDESAPETEGVDPDAMADFADTASPTAGEAVDEGTDEGDEPDQETGAETGDAHDSSAPAGGLVPDDGPSYEDSDGLLGQDPSTETATELEEDLEPFTGEQEGPEYDEELPLAAHIEEMVRRLLVVIAVAGVVTLIAYPLSEDLIQYLWTSHIPNPAGNRPRVYGPLEFILTKLKVASLSGTIIGLPVLVYQTYRFMRPGLYPHERRYYLAAIPTSLVLALVGIAFAHFVVLPSIFIYFTSYTKQAAIVAYGLRETFNLILVLMGYMAIVFQIPLMVMLATMMDLVSRQWLQDKRLLFWGSFAGIAFLVSPDPTGMAPIIIAATMIVLFEGTLLLLRWTNR